MLTAETDKLMTVGELLRHLILITLQRQAGHVKMYTPQRMVTHTEDSYWNRGDFPCSVVEVLRRTGHMLQKAFHKIPEKDRM